MTGNTSYYVAFSNTTALTLSTLPGGANITLTAATTNPGQVHTLTGNTATGYVDINTVYPTVTHAGWVVRREGTGGRAGRIHYETLVAMGSLGTNTVTSTGVYGPIDTITSNTVDKFV